MRPDQAGVVGEDDRLDPVAEVELAQDRRDVGLDRGLGDHQRLGDLALDLAIATSRSTSTSRSVSPVSDGGVGVWPGSVSANRSSSRRVTEGASRASPRATTRTASTRSAGRTSLSMKPLAPGPQCREDRVVDVVGGQHDEPRSGCPTRRSRGSPAGHRHWASVRRSARRRAAAGRRGRRPRARPRPRRPPRGRGARRGSCGTRRAPRPGRRRARCASVIGPPPPGASPRPGSRPSGRAVASRVPPTSAARSRMPSMPWPLPCNCD